MTKFISHFGIGFGMVLIVGGALAQDIQVIQVGLLAWIVYGIFLKGR